MTLLLALTCAYAGGGKKDFAIIYIGNSITYGALHENRNETAPPVYTSQMLAKKFKANVIWRNCGWSGATTYDFLPSHKRYVPRVEKAIKEIQAETNAPIVFSIMLGTNDSANFGPNGSPVSNEDYKKNLMTMIGRLRELCPEAVFVLQRPIWYSPNTHNGAQYLVAGQKRMVDYTNILIEIALENDDVYMGDSDAFDYFQQKHRKYMFAEDGKAGIFYLHPNEAGARKLARFWARGIVNALK